SNANEKIFDSLNRLGVKVIPTIKHRKVHQSIAYHPDIVMHPVNHNTLVIAPEVFPYYNDKLCNLNLKLIKGKKELKGKYPLNIAYNVGRINRATIHNFKYTDEILKFYLQKENLKLINIKQGYTKCSMAIIDDNSVITSDYPIYNKLIKLGYNVLLIKPGYIDLKYQNYGFIGGSSGNLSKNTILLSGKLDIHPDKEKILNFIAKYRKKVIYLSNKNISDIGSIINLYCN